MGALHEGWMILAALIPSIGLLFLFWVILKHLLEGDRRERAAIRRWEEEQAAEQAGGGPDGRKGTPSTHSSKQSSDHDGHGREGGA